jgi:2-polyprenyl-3-methyl-5-hydroxy-6-metoxy-1,4-benzoquinol methylase
VARRRGRLFKFAKALEAAFVSNLLPYRHSHYTRERWEEEYASGHWDYLRTLEQAPRYRHIAGCCEHFRPGGSVLDVGCGDGVLQEILAPGYSRYLGIDLSAEAIDRAASRADARTRFVRSAVDGLALDERFDAIVFNESLYYFEKPLPVLERCASLLERGGIFVISMHDLRPWNRRLWKEVEALYPPLDEVTVAHGSGKSWTIKVFAPGGPSPGGGER